MKNNNTFDILTWSRETHLNDFLLLNNNDILIKSIFLNWNLCLLWWNEYNQNIITINDTFNTRGLNNEEIIESIKSSSWIDVENKEWIEKLNDLFIRAVDFIHNTLYKNVWNNIRHNKEKYFSNSIDVINFLRETEKGKKVSKTHCRIAKVVYWMNDILRNPELLESENNAKDIIRNKIAPWIQIDDFNMLMNYNNSKCTIVLDWKIINFKLKFRWKESDSALLKVIYNPECHSSDLLKDPIWMELVCKNENDIILLLDHFYTVLFEEKIEKIKPKWFDVMKMTKLSWIHKKFKKILEKTSKNKWKKNKSNTNDDYMDLKILGKIKMIEKKTNINKFYCVEFRASLEWHKESNIFKSDPIYYLWKIILASIRLDWYVTENYIKIIINNFYEKNPDMKEKINNIHLLNYLTKSLIKIDRSSKSNIYTSSDRYNTLNDTEFYPENIIKENNN